MYGMPIQSNPCLSFSITPAPIPLTIRTLPPNHPVFFQTRYADFSAEMCRISVMPLQFFWNRISLQIRAAIWTVFFMNIHVISRPSLIGFGSVCLLKWHLFLIENAVLLKTPIIAIKMPKKKRISAKYK